ncbi:MAG TPA: aminopeptidase P family N-terminal domain-containing protein, partial [Clostridia bacterium]|nr:aminopeptidase P family N-terminal domain-containing protein [Clostridia bacterium]
MRIERLNKLLARTGCDAAIIMKPQNIFYFTGFWGDDSFFCYDGARAAILTDSRYTEQARAESGCEVIESNNLVADVIDLLKGK